jgi:tRNA A22 N-methylase
MNKLPFRLSERLSWFLPYLSGELWDIGADHGYLGLQALYEKRVTQVHLLDRQRDFLGRMRVDWDEFSYEQWWGELKNGELKRTLQADNLMIWERDAAQMPAASLSGTILCAGVGGENIWRALKSQLNTMENKKQGINTKVHTLCLGPNSHPERLWKLCEENSEGEWLAEFSCEEAGRTLQSRVWKVSSSD